MERLELHLTYTCPEQCVFCSEDHRMTSYKAFPVTFGRVATVLRQQAGRGVKSVHFTGGEPTIHPRFIDVLKLAKKLGMRTSIGTIGTRLADRAFAERALPYLDEGLFSIHGPTAEVHNALTRRDWSFDRVTTAFRNCVELKPSFGAFVNTVVTRHNVDVLPETAAMVDEMGAQLLIISNLTPEGAGLDTYEALAVPLERLAEVLPLVPPRVKSAVVRFFAVPMCVLGEHAMLSNDLHWDPRVTVEWASEPGKVVFDGLYSWAPDRKRTHVSACEDCDKRGLCMGVFERYTELWSVDRLRRS
jgi:MoaA/NifB/PqqE/SkfB family radical SAM enzyme